MGEKDYETGARVLSSDERARIRQQIEAELEAERLRAAAEEKRRAEELRRSAREREKRPAAERLLEARCLHCHDSERIELAQYGRIGWYATILRMRWLNGAEFSTEEMSVIAGLLTERHPPPVWWTAIEWLLLAAPGLLLWSGWRWWTSLANSHGSKAAAKE
jgi:hypothetical protein